MVERKELQERIIAYRILESRLESLLKQRDLLVAKILEIQTTLQSIDEIKKSKSGTLFPIGSDVLVFGKIADKKRLIVEVGANVALEKSVEESKKVLEKRKLVIEGNLNELQKNIADISMNLEQLGPEIEELAKGLEKTKEAG